MLKILISFTLLIAAQFSFSFSYTLEITEPELQEKVSVMMPMEKKKWFVTVKISEPIVDLIKDSNEIGVSTNVEVLGPGGMQSAGRANIKGTLIYDAVKGAFFFHNPTVVNLNVDKLPGKFAPKVKQIFQLAISSAMSRYPVYQFKEDEIKHKLAKATLKSIAVKNEVLYLTLGMF